MPECNLTQHDLKQKEIHQKVPQRCDSFRSGDPRKHFPPKIAYGRKSK